MACFENHHHWMHHSLLLNTSSLVNTAPYHCVLRASLQVMQPGFLHKQLPTEAPQQGEKWDVIMKDVEDKIVPGAFQRQI